MKTGTSSSFKQDDFLKLWLSKTEHDIELRAFPSKDRRFTRDTNEIDSFIKAHAKEDVYYAIGSREGGGTKNHVREIPYLWADMDFKGYPEGETEARYQLSQFPLLPSIIINSGGGLHAYWVIENPVEPSPRFEAILRGIASALHSDRAVCEVARIMRVPGTFNHKYNPPREVVIESLTDDEYALEDFAGYEVEASSSQATTGKARISVEEINKRCAFLAHAYQNPDLPEPLWYAVISNLCRVSPGGPSLCQEYSKGHPGYDEREVNEKILQAQDNSGPHTCDYIKDQGFDCGKDCGVKAPIVRIQREERTEARDVDEEPVRPINDATILSERPFPFDVFPERFLKVVANVAEAHRVEREMVASSMLCVFSGAVGNTVRVSPKAGYTVNLQAWLINIMPTGYGKSPIFAFLARPLDKLQAAEYQRYSEALKFYEQCLHDTKRGKTVDIPDKPRMKHFSVSDATVEALGGVFEDDSRGVLIHQDEISGLILGLDQYKGKGNDRQHYLTLFNGGTWKIDRKSGSKFITNTGAAIIGGIQTGVMPRVFGEDSFDDGLLPRFLLQCSDGKPTRFSRRGIDEASFKYWQSILARAYAIPFVLDDCGFVDPKMLILMEEALDAWVPFYDQYNEIMPYLSERARVFIPKYTGYYSLKFAGLLHCLNSLNTPSGDISGLINRDVVEGAIELTKYFAGQAVKALRLYEPAEDRLNDFQKRAVETLYQLRDQVNHGKLALSSIMAMFNEGLPPGLQHNGKQVGSILRGLGLVTQKSTGGVYSLVWEDTRIRNLFAQVIQDSGLSGLSGLVSSKNNSLDEYVSETMQVFETEV